MTGFYFVPRSKGLNATQHALAAWLETPHGSPTQIPPIEGLRGLATLLVFLVHYVTLIEPWLAERAWTFSMAGFLGAIGHSGVDLFFVLSGFLIYGGLLGRRVSLDRYFKRRIKRIYPTFTAVFLLYTAAFFLVPDVSKLPPRAMDQATYLAANYLLLPGMLPLEPMITVAWSLSFEMFFYLVCPLVVYGLRLALWPTAWRVGLFVLMSVALLALAPQIESRARLAMFLCGMTLHETLRPASPRLLTVAAVGAIAAACVVCYQVAHVERAVAVWTAAWWIAFFVLAFSAFQSDGPLVRLFSWTPLRWFGNMSYSFFLLHGFVLRGLFFMLERVVPPENAWEVMFWLLLLPAFLLALIPSAVLFLLIERPFSLRPAPSIGMGAGG